MSIYSGFATRQQQETYDHCLNSLLYILQKRILKFYTNSKTDQYKFSNLVQKMYLQMKHMQKSKYLDPKCSYAINQLFDYLMKQNHSQNNATIENSSNQQHENRQTQVNRNKIADQKPLNESFLNDQNTKHKTYQIPIRTQKQSSEKKKIRGSNSAFNNMGKILSSISKEKVNPLNTIELRTNQIKKRTPSASQENRLVQNRMVYQNKKKQLSIHQLRNMSFNQEQRNHKPFSKSSNRIDIDSDFRQQNQIHEILGQYTDKGKRIQPSSSQYSSGSKLRKSIKQQEPYCMSKR